MIRNLIERKTLMVVVAMLCSFRITAQEVRPLYQGAIPNVRSNTEQGMTDESSGGLIRRVIIPTVEIYLPEKEKSTGAAVVICPGGSYKVIVYQGEGVATAKEFARQGEAAFILKYRLPDDALLLDKKIGPIQDALQAIKLVRENAAQFGVDPTKVGIAGFSAGGHLASAVATHYDEGLIENTKHTNLRPYFQILVYPGISKQDSMTHLDSRKNLLGDHPSKDIIHRFSSEYQVDEETPPAYITHTADDNLVDVDNSIAYFEQLRHHKVPVELHIYPEGGHGFIFKRKNWMVPLMEWMKNSGWIK